ncbi:MAG: GTP-binding protein [Thelocarpon impressellum]|nr:MAG: GTP-binding protein [Thelocarpon impressellum]
MVSLRPSAHICLSCARRSRPPQRQPRQLRSSSTAAQPAYLQLPPSALSHHWETVPPTPSQLAHADALFTRHPPRFLTSAPHLRDMHHDPASSAPPPEVAFLGRSNVGKSSLLNALLGKKGLCHTSGKPGKTRAMNAIEVAGGKLVVLDMPGYGKGGRAEWGVEVVKYLKGRRQLRRAFLLIDALHGPKPTDLALLAIFREHAIPHQLVLSKVDRILFPSARTPSPGAFQHSLQVLDAAFARVREVAQPPGGRDGPPALGELLACSAEKSVPGGGGKLGVGSLRFAVLAAVGLEGSKAGRWRRADVGQEDDLGKDAQARRSGGTPDGGSVSDISPQERTLGNEDEHRQ